MNRSETRVRVHLAGALFSLPAGCYYGVASGNSIPTGFGIQAFADDNGTHVTWYIMRTGQSWNGATASYDMATTLERDDTP